ncbi:MAG TPA: aminopeptidase P family N-terminal domain-containing protein, partial [Terriglobia bacterium]|nr:aminopeptidase P family N-terminal domain-containing protein [Terriglobia bacterium]
MPKRREFLKTLGGVAAGTIAVSARAFGQTRVLSLSATVPQGGGDGHDRLEPEWYKKKIAQIQAGMAKRKLDALVLLDSHNVIYTTGYFHLTTERPLAALIPKSGD